MSQIEFNKPTIKRKDMDAVLQTMVDEKIGPGQRRQAFRDALLQLTEKKAGLVFRTYSYAIEVAFLAAGLESGQKVAVSPLTPSIYRKVADRLGLQFILVDIDRENCCIDLEKAMGCGCDAILLFEPFGTIPYKRDYSSVGMPVIEDISQSIGSFYDFEKAGGYGDIVIGSLEEADLVSSAGGSFVLTSKPQYAKKLEEFDSQYEALPDLNSALGLVQLSNFDERLKKRKVIYKLFCQKLLSTENRLFGISNIDFEINGGYFCVLLNSKPQDAIKFGEKYQVPIRMAFPDAVGGEILEDFDHFPVSIPYLLRGVHFPIYPFLTSNEVETISKVISHLL